MNISQAIDRPRRPAIKWHGAKWRLAKWIISHLPDDHDCYVEPYGGSAAVLLQKPRSRIEVYNDLDEDILNYFTILREKPYDLIQTIKYTPYHYLEYQLSSQPTDDPLERARRFYVSAYQSIMGPTASWTNGFRRQKVYSRGTSGKSSMKPAAISFTETSHLWTIADRLRGVVFEHMDALQLMKQYDHPRTLFYIDPPYLQETRTQQHPAYKHELLTAPEHVTFLNHVKGLQGIPLISGYDNALYQKHLVDHGWKAIHKHARTNGQNQRKETLWLSPRLQSLIKGKSQ